jgi:serine/threonine-protein kinase RsbW
MIDSTSSTGVANAERFERVGIEADAESASRTREEFAGWLEQFFDLDPIRSSDLVLAINEALANAVEFAYLTTDLVGTIDMQARYDSNSAKLTVTVSDHGVWRTPDPTIVDRTRGRGIPLMRALSDRASIETSSRGTRVRLQWVGITGCR